MSEAQHSAPGLVRGIALGLSAFSAVLFAWLAVGPAASLPGLLMVTLGVLFSVGFALIGIGVDLWLSVAVAGRLLTSGLILLTLVGSALDAGVDSPILVLGVVTPLMALVLVSGPAAALAFLAQTVGALVLLFSGDELHWSRALTLLAATTLAWLLADRLWRDSAGLSAELEIRERTDPLTGVANRRAFFEALRAYPVSRTRSDDVVSVVLLEIDAFNDLCERYGNRTADRCTMDIAEFLVECMRRETDTVARLSAGEFGVVLGSTTPFNAHSLVTRAMTLVRDVRIAHEGSRHGIVTLSAGVCLVERGAPDESVRRARAALNAAKAAGGDQAVTHGDSSMLPFPQLRQQDAESDVQQ